MSKIKEIIILLLIWQPVFSQESSGRIDTSFHIGLGANRTVDCIAKQPDQKILIGGFFNSYDGHERNLIARLDKNGNVDETFIPDQIGWEINDAVYSIMVTSNGQILVGGDFTNAEGLSDSGLKLLNSDGTQATNWFVDGKIYCMAKQSDGKIILGGQCYSYGATTVKRIFRINPDYSIDSTFNTMTEGANGGVFSIAIQSDGKILIGVTVKCIYKATPFGFAVRVGIEVESPQTAAAVAKVGEDLKRIARA